MTFKTINNTTPLFEGTDTHALVGHSSYSVTGTNSFSAIHAEVEGQEYTPFGAPATTNGPRRIGRDEFLGNENNGNAVGKDEEVPMGDMLLPLLVMAGCMILFKCRSIIKNSRAMKKFFSLFVFSLLSVGTLVAQNNYLQNGDIVSISTDITNGDGGGEGRRYLDNYAQTQNNVNDNCLWELGIENGQYTFKALSTNQYLSVYIPGDPQSARLVMADNPTSFSFIPTGNGGEEGKYLCGSFSHSFFYQPWNNTYAIYIARYWGQSFTADPWNSQTTLYIEKWKKKGGNGGPTGFFTPEKAEFTYAENDSAATEQATSVTFTLRSQIESYYECVTREEILLRRQTETIDLSGVTPTFYWESSKNETSTLDLSKYNTPHTETENRAMMLISNATTNGQTSSFYITPQGGSPMGLKQYIYSEGDTIQGIERWVDYADRVIAQYTYKGQTYTETMRVVRKAYHEEELPSLVFSINPVTYTFAQKAESVDINITPTHQHGRVLYNSDNQEINKEYTEGPTPIKLTNSDWQLSIDFTNNDSSWLSWEPNGDYKIKVKATENGTKAKRSSVLTGTFRKTNGSDIHSGTFTIPLAQRYKEGGIQFHTKSSNDTAQLVHTSERTIYYLPNEEIELRPAESGYSGYMRWYDYKTGMDPYYNENPIDSTTWILSPRAASGAAFSAINTPQNNNTYEADGRSYGLYAINKEEGGVLNEDNPANPAPKIKGWDYTSKENASHTIACDMSAYRDYVITDTTFANEEKRILSITEPTLSYRQLFHLKPAEEMAEKFDALKAGEYLEEYHYQAPVGKAVLLATEFRFDKVRSHKSEMCYFYRGSDEKLHRIESGTKWYVSTLQADGTYSAPEEHNPTYTSTMDYLSINSTAPQTQIYTLILPAGTANNSTDLRIARFTVTFVPVRECGPTNEVLITPQRINSEFKRLATIDFNANTNHLPWDESSYGFVYTSGELADTKYARGASQGVFPFYGEYMLTPQVNKDWARASAKTGNALYVDGTMEPGLVASISANTVICSGQTLYCSAWFCNPTPQAWNSEGNPIFRCNVQGRNIVEIVDGKTTFTPWEDVEAYFVGELPKNSGWQQINFPIVSAHNYDQTRVAIYNFATTNLGNDFMVDDITLYVSQLPIAAYQGKMACRSIDSDTTSAAAVLRIDYSKIEPGGDGFMYYQIYNNSYNNGEGAPVVLEEESAYYHDNTYDHDHNNTKNEYGSVTIPDQHFDPEVYNADKDTLQKVAIYQSVSKFLDDLVAEKKDHGKAYVKTENNGVTKWLLYVAHIIPNTDKMEEALDSLFDEHSYSMRMAYTPNELKKPECNLQTPLHATQQTVFKLRNSDGELINQRDKDGNLLKEEEKNVQHFMMHSVKNCANDLYFLDIKVINHLAVSTGNNINNLEAPIYADWLIGDSIDDIYGQVRSTDEEELKKYLIADSIFKLNHGGYTHGQVTTAIMYDMRRLPVQDGKTIQEKNPNYYAKTFEELDPNAFLSPQNYTIVKYLHDNELLQMYTPTVHFYLASQDTARYWAFPIAETAKVVNDDGDTIVLKDCNEPRWVTVSSQSSDYFLNITPLDKEEKTLYQRTQIPNIKVVARNSKEIIIPIKEITDDNKVKINGTLYTKDATITINLPSLPEGFKFYDIERSTAIDDAPDKLEPGETYTMRVAFQEENGFNYPGDYSGAENACRIGFVFFNIEVVPNTLVWTPTGTSMNGWGKNENWKGWIDNGDHKIDNTELVEGFVPMSGTNVIIPNLQNPLIYPYIVPEEEHNHYPMTVYHDQHKCDTIYFAAGAHMNNQHLLEYKAAFVDMILPKQGEWYMMSAPLQNMVSGDMFIPHTGTYTDGSIIAEPNPFMVSSFQGTRDNIAAYAFWTAFYNQSVQTWYEDGSAKVSTSAEFQQSNGLGNLLPPGGGFQLLGFGPDDEEDIIGKAEQNDTLVVRLPKPDTLYTSSSGRKVKVDKPNAHLLAFTPDKAGKMTITLTNAIEDNSFIFGNPTMAFINMHEFLHDNQSVLQHEFYRLSGSTWTAVNASTMSSSERFLAPMNAVKLVARKDTNELTVILKTSHLTLNNQYNPLSETIQEQRNTNKHIQRQAPSQNETEVLPEILTVYAFSKGNHARTILAIDNQANDYYVQGEDMLFISSGVEGNSTSVVETPVNMYTAAEKTPMMVDVRQGVSQIPLAFLMAKNKKADTFELAFYLSPNWTRTCYLLDKVTGQRRRIMNGSIFTLPMPGNHEERYIIEGPDEYIGEEDKPSTPTDLDTQTAPDTKAYKVLHNQQIYILRNGHTYTLTGLEVK